MNFIITQPEGRPPIDFDDCHITLFAPRTPGYYGGGGSRWKTKRRKKLRERRENYIVDFPGVNPPRFAVMITRGSEVIARTNLITTTSFNDIELMARSFDIPSPVNLTGNLPSVRELNRALSNPKLNLLDITYSGPVDGRLTVTSNAEFRTRNNGNFKPVRVTFSFKLTESDNPIWNDDTDDAYLVVHRPNLNLAIRNAFYYSFKTVLKGIIRPKIIKSINDSVNEIIANNALLNAAEQASGAFTFNESPLTDNRITGTFLEKQ